MKQTVAKLLDIADRTVYKWKKEKRPIISFLYQYFSKNDIQEYLESGKMQKLEFLNLSDPINAFELHSISTILHKIEAYVEATKVNREGFLIKLYRTVRDYDGKIEEFVVFLKNYDMKTLESLRNMRFGSSLDDVAAFYQNYLSKQEQELLFNRKLHFLPPLKSMRKYNAHIKD